MITNTMQRILIADDEPLFRETTAEFLREEGFECLCVEDANDAISVLNEHPFDLILSDLNMPGNLKFELLKEGRTKHSDVPMIVITGAPSLPSAIESVRLGVTDYLLKPVKLEDLLIAVQRSLSQAGQHLKNERSASSDPVNSDTESDGPTSWPNELGILGNSSKMQEVLEIVERVAMSDTNVLVTGESGTGKEVIANAIHHRSHRRANAMQVIDCTSIPESLFESALFGHIKGSFTGAVKDQAGLLRACDRGTAFIDELGELPLSSQAKLLRVIQEQTFTPVGDSQPIRVNTRFVCATNRDLQAEVDADRFRHDLYYRLAVVHIELPPLRERGDDVILLANAFLKKYQRSGDSPSSFAAETLDCFRNYRWPGNIRELRNVVERSVALATDRVIQPTDLPKPLRDSLHNPQPETLDLAEVSRDIALDTADRAYLLQLLEKHQGVIASAARQAGLSRQGMNKLLKRHNIDANDFRR
ncbi:sigma-54-dependent transcriptional regulator [Rhodopirellula bahusiensis]|uniref:Two-component system response regulator n=1 Tax=Rhodopirellula bahusiensis TaxID=2014065 RepID=A0A2G1WB58_9BACT|nr:sigma-54 dependent transcriptional regulator [Rhodopirellula bahusiensis]PHQ35869.1 two-component system response regulator [Rhodopirellula bahusiensis]